MLFVSIVRCVDDDPFSPQMFVSVSDRPQVPSGEPDHDGPEVSGAKTEGIAVFPVKRRRHVVSAFKSRFFCLRSIDLCSALGVCCTYAGHVKHGTKTTADEITPWTRCCVCCSVCLVCVDLQVVPIFDRNDQHRLVR